MFFISFLPNVLITTTPFHLCNLPPWLWFFFSICTKYARTAFLYLEVKQETGKYTIFLFSTSSPFTLRSHTLILLESPSPHISVCLQTLEANGTLVRRCGGVWQKQQAAGRTLSQSCPNHSTTKDKLSGIAIISYFTAGLWWALLRSSCLCAFVVWHVIQALGLRLSLHSFLWSCDFLDLIRSILCPAAKQVQIHIVYQTDTAKESTVCMKAAKENAYFAKYRQKRKKRDDLWLSFLEDV